MTKLSALTFLFSFLLLASVAQADFFTSDNLGTEKTSFYSTETVYITSDTNITPESDLVRVYIVANSDSWTNGTTLTSVTSYTTIQTNASGNISTTAIWELNLEVGNYDLVIDTNNDGMYNDTYDLVNNLTSTGFQVTAAPSLAFALGEKSPSNHNWYPENTTQNIMMQIKITIGSAEDIILYSMDFLGGGTGDDRNGISVVRVFLDSAGAGGGKLNESNVLLAFGKYNSDDGIYRLIPEDGYELEANSTIYMLVTYAMDESFVEDDQTFDFQIVSISGIGKLGTTISVSGLPLSSITKTAVVSEVPADQNTTSSQNTTSCSSYTNESSCIAETCKWCDVDSSCRNMTESCPIEGCSGPPSISFTGGENFTLMVSGLDNCNGKTVDLKSGNCTGTQVGSCVVSGSNCSVSFVRPSSGNYTYYACVDIDGDDTIIDNEQGSFVISVQRPSTTSQPIEKKPLFNYLYLVILAVVVAVVGIVIFLIYKKKKKGAEYQDLKEKWEDKSVF